MKWFFRFFSLLFKNEKTVCRSGGFALYMQACLAYVNFGTIGNSDIRMIFGLEEKESYKASRVMKDTIEAGLIKAIDDNAAPRHMKYIPHWA